MSNDCLEIGETELSPMVSTYKPSLYYRKGARGRRQREIGMYSQDMKWNLQELGKIKLNRDH